MSDVGEESGELAIEIANLTRKTQVAYREKGFFHSRESHSGDFRAWQERGSLQFRREQVELR